MVPSSSRFTESKKDSQIWERGEKIYRYNGPGGEG